VAWLQVRPVTSVHALRRHRFTLRMVAAAEREGLVAVDFEAGTVAILAPRNSVGRDVLTNDVARLHGRESA
jgi:hypothetical protein